MLKKPFNAGVVRVNCAVIQSVFWPDFCCQWSIRKPRQGKKYFVVLNMKHPYFGYKIHIWSGTHKIRRNLHICFCNPLADLPV